MAWENKPRHHLGFVFFLITILGGFCFHLAHSRSLIRPRPKSVELTIVSVAPHLQP